MAVATMEVKQRWLVRLGVVGIWVLFTAMVIAISWTGAAMRGRPFDPGGTIVWNLGWLLWAGVTFVVATLARKLPLERQRLARGLGLHALCGIAIAAATLCLEFALNLALSRIWPALRPNAFVGFFVYKFHVYFLIYALVVGATRAIDYYTRFRASALLAAQLETQLAHAQLEALKTQLHPHFLFNTHHSIISLMLQNENAAAIKMLTRLSDLLRITLQRTDRQVTSLREELEALELYLGIQKERYRERLAVQLVIDPLALDADVPCLLLQPLVENAFKHGLDSLTTRGEVRIDVRRVEDNLHVSIIDNGPGVDEDFDPAQTTGVGLRNTQDRLARLYGRDQHFTVRRGRDGGTEVRLIFPHRVTSVAPDAVAYSSPHANA